jgi:hypothetical protein
MIESLTWKKQFIRHLLKFVNRDLATRVRLHLRVELIVFLHAGFTSVACGDSGTEFLKVHTDTVQGETTSAVGTLNSGQLG